MTPLAFCDTETTGLDPEWHQIWEVGLILRDARGVESERQWFLPVDLGTADAFGLSIGRYHERHPQGYDYRGTEQVTSVEEFVTSFCYRTRGAHLVGAVISFDEERLRKLLRGNGACPEWHYHLIDVENLAAGWVAAGGVPCNRPPVEFDGSPPWDSEALSSAVGVDPERFDRHTALGDARWAKAIYDAVMGVPE